MLVKRVAVGLEIDGDGPEDILPFELSEYPSLKNVDVKIENGPACQWIHENMDNFPSIEISGPAFCKKNDDDGGLRISEGEIAGWVISTVGLVGLIIMRKKIR